VGPTVLVLQKNVS